MGSLSLGLFFAAAALALANALVVSQFEFRADRLVRRFGPPTPIACLPPLTTRFRSGESWA